MDISGGMDERSKKIRSMVACPDRLSLVEVEFPDGFILAKRRRICDCILFVRVLADDVE